MGGFTKFNFPLTSPHRQPQEVLTMGLTLRLDYIAMLASFVLLAGVLIGAF